VHLGGVACRLVVLADCGGFDSGYLLVFGSADC
jgi:hypothetical protein